MKVIVFGTGEDAINFINKTEDVVVAFVDNDYIKERDLFCNLPVAVPERMNKFDFDSVVIALPFESDMDKHAVTEVVAQLDMIGVNKDIFVYVNGEILELSAVWGMLNSFLNEDYAPLYEALNPKSIAVTHKAYIRERCNKRKLYLYGTGYAAISLTRYLRSIGVDVEKYISDMCELSSLDGKEIISTIDLVYEDTEKIFIITVCPDESYAVTRKKLLGLGLTEDYDFTYYSEIPGTDEPFYYDTTLSFSRIRDKLEGFEEMGDENGAIKILTLGGSTTESKLFFVDGWTPFFSELITKNGISAKVYCGGISGYTSTQELLKFERDVLSLNPDIVISYSGVNDLYMYPYAESDKRYGKPFITKFQVQFIDQVLQKLSGMQYGLPVPDIPDWEKGGRDIVFYGLKNHKTPGRFWVDNMRMMHALSAEFGIKFFSFLQPYRFNGYYNGSEKQRIIHTRRDPSCDPPEEGKILYGRDEELYEMRKLIEKYDYITDLSELFIDKSEVYYDSVHVYEEGNKIIARKIFETLLEKHAFSDETKINGR